jgi:hypothetical protein
MRAKQSRQSRVSVMAGLVPAIHAVQLRQDLKAIRDGVAGIAGTSPAMMAERRQTAELRRKLA